jgi:large subunit ribosomal protein L5
MTQEPALLTDYKNRVLPALREKHGYSNVHQIPKITKVVINTCIGSAPDVKESLEIARTELTTITGQRPVTTMAKKAISNFKLREAQAIGAKVTLRGRIMYEFLERLIKTALPRIRDFRGLPAHSWDGRGNYTFGLAEQIMFPEIEYDKIDAPHGMDITIVTTATSDDDGKALLDAFGFPFKRGKDAGPKPKKVVRRRGPGGPGKGKK